MSTEESSIHRLSEKLIAALERQAALEDWLAQLQLSDRYKDKRIDNLEKYRQEKEDLIAQGKLFYRPDTDVADSQARGRRHSIDREIEDLTSSLFEEANRMVSEARQNAAEFRRRNEKLEEQLQETEALLRAHQGQLTELKSVLAENEVASTPSTPALGFKMSVESFGRLANSSHGQTSASPAHPLAYGHLIKPILAYDTPAYADFLTVLRQSQRGRSSAPLTPTHSPIVSSQAFFSASVSPAVGTGQLKDTRFYKRMVVEDIEPALRLDIAPGLSWLARRNVMTSITDGTLQIDPISVRTSMAPCALCSSTPPTHTFRTSDTATIHPLCIQCVARLRSVCDFVGFLRAVRDGGWKSEGEEGEQRAWEECTRLRERMFWSKIGGGVIPAFIPENTIHHDSAASESAEMEGDVTLGPTSPSTNGASDEINESFEDAEDNI